MKLEIQKRREVRKKLPRRNMAQKEKKNKGFTYNNFIYFMKSTHCVSPSVAICRFAPISRALLVFIQRGGLEGQYRAI